MCCQAYNRLVHPACFVHDYSPNVQKMDPKAYKAIYVGYDIESNSHKVLNADTKMVKTTVNVKFDITPFNTAMLKSSLKMTRPKTVRNYTKKLKTVDSITSPSNQLSGSNDSNSVIKSSLDNLSTTSSEACNNPVPSVSMPNPSQCQIR